MPAARGARAELAALAGDEGSGGPSLERAPRAAFLLDRGARINDADAAGLPTNIVADRTAQRLIGR
jgi:hypothetical protein